MRSSKENVPKNDEPRQNLMDVNVLGCPSPNKSKPLVMALAYNPSTYTAEVRELSQD